ncbi:uncharacterized protein LOC100202561 isoform X2 [Hydra vulgaris]|uniref:Uncharacterized protein LOC100202561 isoform X2 n=1 Tax=Hydra vulgaris TaxID=6087 RepID=A0ABM4C4P5_HYDVU
MSCMFCDKGLDLDTAIRLLENIDFYPIINQPPVKPKGGEVFIYLPDTVEEQENYKCDQYRWLNSGPKEIPRKNPLVKKQYFIGKLPHGKTQAFQKHCYVLVSDHRSPYPVLLHYIGDESVMVDYPHGNSKKSNLAYFAIAPSVRKDIASRSQTLLPTAIINAYKSSPSSYILNENGESDINPVLTPRNKSQVRNIRRKQKLSRVKDRIPREDLATLHSVFSELLGFCVNISTYPELLCIVGLTEINSEIEKLIKLNNNTVVCSFQESYKIGHYFLTPFSFIHCAFESSPSVPLYFLITEICDFTLYEKFLAVILESVPALEEAQAAVIISQDYMLSSAVNIVFPNWVQVYDWEHLFTAARAFLRKQNVDIKEISLRINQLKTLMNMESVDDYKSELLRLQEGWPVPFKEYYTQVLLESIEKKLGRWLLERFKLYCNHVGVLRADNSDLQLVVKNLQDLKEPSLDIILPSLYHLQTYVHVNIQKGFCNTGLYSLHSSFKFLSRGSDELILPSVVYEPSSIVKIFRVRGITMFSECPDTGDESSCLLQAQRILEMGHISHCTDLKAFLVKSTSGSLNGVQLFPRESCSCSINQRCAHIMAVMLALGMPLTYDKKGSIKVIKPENALHESDEGEKSDIVTITDTPDVSTNQDDVEDMPEIKSCVDVGYPTLGSCSYQENPDEQPTILEVTSEMLQNVLNASEGNEVLMVVTDENSDKPMIAYQMTQEALLAYTQHIHHERRDSMIENSDNHSCRL